MRCMACMRGRMGPSKLIFLFLIDVSLPKPSLTMKKANKKKLTLDKIKIAKLSNTRQHLQAASYPTEALTCAVCDPMTITENAII